MKNLFRAFLKKNFLFHKIFNKKNLLISFFVFEGFKSSSKDSRKLQKLKAIEKLENLDVIFDFIKEESIVLREKLEEIDAQILPMPEIEKMMKNCELKDDEKLWEEMIKLLDQQVLLQTKRKFICEVSQEDVILVCKKQGNSRNHCICALLSNPGTENTECASCDEYELEKESKKKKFVAKK